MGGYRAFLIIERYTCMYTEHENVQLNWFFLKLPQLYNRARWKGYCIQQDRYTTVQLLWPDISVASHLCNDGICLYKPVNGSGITDEWFIENITPNIASAFSKEVTVILGKELQWAAFEPSLVGVIPDNIRRHVMASFVQLNTRVRANGGASIAVGDDDVNPI